MNHYSSGPISVLGCTGSVGKQALEVAARFGIPVAALAAGRNVRAAEEAARLFHPDIIAMFDEAAAKDLMISLADTGIKVLSGADGVRQAAAYEKSETVVNSVSGISGLMPTMAAIEAGKKLALANKESLVAAGGIVMKAAKDKGISILPVDSEHSAIFQCLEAGVRPEKLILTCSGGPFFGRTADQLKDVKVSDALAHPTWNMGARITIDSATLMNKGFEVIEASWLFGIAEENIEVTVHRESVVHSMVQFSDGSVKAQLSCPDMRLCVMYALSYPRRMDALGFTERLDFRKGLNLSFSEPDTSTFTLLPLARECHRLGGVHGAALNGADEEAVCLFLDGRIGFTDIMTAAERAALSAPDIASPSLDDIYQADKEAREMVRSYFN